MSDIYIKTAKELGFSNKSPNIIDLKEIFFESSNRKTFNDDIDKERFFMKWCGEYLVINYYKYIQ